MAVRARRVGSTPAAIAMVVALAATTVTACSGGATRSPAAAPSLKAVPAATVAEYTQRICGGLRAVRVLADRLHALAPDLQGDSVSRTGLKAELVRDLSVASRAATMGARFVSATDVHGRADLAEHRDSVVRALEQAAGDYTRWRILSARFPTFDRDNWEVALLSTEGGVIRAGAWGAWQAIARAVGEGPVGAVVSSEAAAEPTCRAVVG